jgi:hypothetical protein
MQTVLCEICKNYIGDLKCFAFPDGIPEKILTGEEDHKKPINGQTNNFVFEEE